MDFRLMSYNIHKCIGGIDRKYKPERVIATISHYNPDIVLLQEVDDGVPRSSHDIQIELLAKSLGYKYQAYQANVKLNKGCYGNAILSRFPLSNINDIDLTVPPKKRRRSIAVHVTLKEKSHFNSIKLLNVHLGLAAFERAIQIKRLIKNSFITHNPHDLPVIIGGDFNDLWQNLCRKVLYENEFSSALGVTKTFPAVYPSRALDRIFYRGDVKTINSFAGHIQLARAASDHLPVISDFSI